MRTRYVMALVGAAAAVWLGGCGGSGQRAGGSPAATNEAEPREVDSELLSQIEQTAADLRTLSGGGAAGSGPVGASEMPSGEPIVASGRPPEANLSPAMEVELPEASPDQRGAQAATDKPERREPERERAPKPAGVEEAAGALAAALRADDGADPVRVYAALAALEMIAPGSAAHPSEIEGLTPEDARALEAWADLMRGADEGLSSAPGDARALARAVLAGAETAQTFEPLGVRHARLCSRVEGYGRYTPMSTTWLRGQPHRAIVYVEVENFASRRAVDGRGVRGHEVRLTQELQLFHDADGLLAWRMPPQDVVDFSRNRRRDFFIAQMIDLPASLSVGKYQLKIAVRDETSGEMSETVAPIMIVADEGLLGPAPK